MSSLFKKAILELLSDIQIAENQFERDKGRSRGQTKEQILNKLKK